MLDPAVRRVLDGTSIAHLAWRCPSRPSTTRSSRGHPRPGVEWIEGDAAWEIVDELATKYTGTPYPRGQERVVLVIEPEQQMVGVG